MAAGYGEIILPGLSSEDMDNFDRRERSYSVKQLSQSRRSITSKPATYPWPAPEVVKNIDKIAAGKRWKEYHDKLDHTGRRIGRAVGLENIQVVLISPEETGPALTEKFGVISAKPNPEGRNRKAREVTQRTNAFIQTMQKQEEQDALVYEVLNTPRLRQQVMQSQGPAWLLERVVRVESGEEVIPKDVRIWRPDTYEVGTYEDEKGKEHFQEAYGPYGIGVTIYDPIDSALKARNALVDFVCSAAGFGLDRAHFTDNSKLKLVKLVDTSPLPVAGVRYRLPGDCPVNLPMHGPHMYLPENT